MPAPAERRRNPRNIGAADLLIIPLRYSVQEQKIPKRYLIDVEAVILCGEGRDFGNICRLFMRLRGFAVASAYLGKQQCDQRRDRNGRCRNTIVDVPIPQRYSPIMTLGEWMSSNRKKRDEVAATLGVSVVTVGRYLTGTRIPDRKIIPKIKNMTGNSVTYDDFLPVEQAEAA